MFNKNLSKSLINLYLTSPCKFYDEVILGEKHKESEHEYTGKTIHSFVEFFWATFKNEKRAPVLKDFSVIPSENNNKLNSKFDVAISNFLNLEKKRYEYLDKKNKLDLFEPIIVEEKLIDEKNKLSGVIDFVDVNEDGSYNIVELKTNREFLFSEYWFELVFYKILLKEVKNINAKFGVVYNPVVAKFNSKEITSSDEKWCWEIINYVKKCVDENLFPHLPGKCEHEKYKFLES